MPFTQHLSSPLQISMLGHCHSKGLGQCGGMAATCSGWHQMRDPNSFPHQLLHAIVKTISMYQLHAQSCGGMLDGEGLYPADPGLRSRRRRPLTRIACDRPRQLDAHQSHRAVQSFWCLLEMQPAVPQVTSMNNGLQTHFASWGRKHTHHPLAPTSHRDKTLQSSIHRGCLCPRKPPASKPYHSSPLWSRI